MELSERSEASVSAHGRAAERYYDEETHALYLNGWNRDHIHFGLFEPGERPEPGESLLESEGLARAVLRMVEEVTAPADIEPGHHVVDAGCGVGGTAIHLAKTAGCTVTGVNINRMQLGIATEKAAEAGLEERVSFAFADCSKHLPFADNSVDIVVSIESACHYSDRGAFLHEVARILKPSGRIALMDWMARDGLTAAEYGKYIEPLCKPFALVSLETQTSYTEKLREAGLEVEQFEGFDGRDADNLRIIEYGSSLLAALKITGMQSAGIDRLHGQLQPLFEAWHSGNFENRRFLARKPAA